MDKAIVKTDIQIAVPHGCYGRVGKCLQVVFFSSVLTLKKAQCLLIQQLFCFLSAPRSGLAAKHFIDVGGKFGVSPTLSVPVLLGLTHCNVERFSLRNWICSRHLEDASSLI